MEDINKNILINQLFDFYGVLLTENQQKMISLHYGLDLSLGEISEQENISRNAVYDSLKKGVALLEEYESKLHLLEKQKELVNYFEDIKKDIDENTKKVVEKIEERIKR